MLYDYLFYFVVYSFIGWCTEVCFCSVSTGKFVNRGFLNGPVCPIYGFGMVIVIYILTPVTENLFLLFFGSMILASALELVTGWALKKLFHTSWWDYSDKPFNLGGYICLGYSFYWAFGGVLMMRVIHPMIADLIAKINPKLGFVFLCVSFAVFAVDFVATILTINKLNKDLKTINKLAEAIHDSSENLAMRIGNKAIKEDEKLAGLKRELSTRKDMLKADVAVSRVFGKQRILKAFPNAKHIDYNDLLEELKQNYGVK